jgi:hypothetical protein
MSHGENDEIAPLVFRTFASLPQMCYNLLHVADGTLPFRQGHQQMSVHPRVHRDNPEDQRCR